MDQSLKKYKQLIPQDINCLQKIKTQLKVKEVWMTKNQRTGKSWLIIRLFQDIVENNLYPADRNKQTDK